MSTIVLSTLLAGMLRAQIIPANEVLLLIQWPVGMVLVIFFAMGPVPSERAERTWPFLLAQPVERGQVLLAKWSWGLLQLLAMMLVATVAGAWALWSRSVTDAVWKMLLSQAPAIVVLSCWYSFLFAVLTRARNEAAAAIGGMILTIALHIWFIQYLFEYPQWMVVLNPVLLFMATLGPEEFLPIHGALWWMVPLHVLVWIVIPVVLMRFGTPRGGQRS